MGCYGVQDLVVNKIDWMDKILTDLTMANHQQRAVAEFVNLHLNKLKVMEALGYQVIKACDWVLSDMITDRREYSTWSSYRSALVEFIPEDKIMLARKQQIIGLLEEI